MKKNQLTHLYNRRMVGWHKVLLIVWIFLQMPLFAAVSLECFKTDIPPKLDGILDDDVWKRAKGYDDFKTFLPDFGHSPRYETIAYASYDADNLYFAFQCVDEEPAKIVASVSKRDSIGGEDYVAVAIDSHGDGQNAYFFMTNPLGIQFDGIMNTDGGASPSQDFIWESAGKKTNTGFAVEFKIPLQSIRFSSAETVMMRIAFFRSISRFSESYVFPEWNAGVGSMLGQLGTAQFVGINCKHVFELLPSFAYMKQRDRGQSAIMDSVDKSKLGLTVKMGITGDVTLDLTVNPDFSHIESDAGQVDVNLRKKPIYAEKRPFFLEGLEHFSFAGCTADSYLSTIVHTRNIVEPVFGLKVTGKLGKSNIINSLFAIDEYSNTHSADGNSDYFGILRYKHLLGGDSYIGTIYTGKEYQDGFVRVGGADFVMRVNGSLFLNAFFLYSDSVEPELDLDACGTAFGSDLNFVNREYAAKMGFKTVSENFYLDPGRLLRNGISTVSTALERYFYLRSNFLQVLTLKYSGNLSRDTHFNMKEYSHAATVQLDFKASSSVSVGYDFATEVFQGMVFDKNTLSVSANSRLSKHIKLALSYSSGDTPYYIELNPFQGRERNFMMAADFQLGEKFLSQFSLIKNSFRSRYSEKKVFDFDLDIYRNRSVFQLNKYLSLRGIVEYNSYYKKILADCLLEFSYIPGTVIHLGYRSTFSKRYVHDETLYLMDELKEIQSYLFFKASYLFRF